MTDITDPIAHAARLLREAADELQQGHTLSGDRNNWIGEPEAKAAYDEHMAAALALEDWEAAVGAGGVQPLPQQKSFPDNSQQAQAAINSGASGGVQALSAGSADPSITLDFKQATELLVMFGGEPGLITLQQGGGKCHSGPGLYAWYSDMPEEGAEFLGAAPDDSASPTPPAEQQATTTEAATPKGDATTGAALGVEPGAVYAELPDLDDTLWLAIGQHRRAITTIEISAAAKAVDASVFALMRDFADRTHALRMKAVAAAANAAGMLLVKTAGNTYALVENSTATATMHPSHDPQAAPKAAPGEQAASAAKGAIMGAAYDFRDAHISGSMNLKRSAHAALEAAVDNALAAPQQEAQYNHGPQAETVEEAARDVGKWLNERPNRPLDLRHVAMLAHYATAPQQEAQERVYLVNTGEVRNGLEMYERHEKPVPLADCELLYTAPQPAPAPLSEQATQAARWRLVETAPSNVTLRLHNLRPDQRAQYIDAALAAQGGK